MFVAAVGVSDIQARKQGVTDEQLEELFLFLSVYAGFNKVAGAFGRLKEIDTPLTESEPVTGRN